MSVHDELKAYLDGELDTQRAEQVRREIDASEELQREVEMLKKIGSSLGHFKGGPTQGKAALLDKLAAGTGSPEPEKPKKSWFMRNRLSFGMAASILVVVTLVTIGQNRGGATEASSQDKVSTSMSSAEISAAPPSRRENEMYKADKSEAQDAIAQKRRAASASSAAAPGGAVPETMRLDREVIHSGSLGVEVENAYDSLSLVGNIATSLGGYLESKTFEKNPEGQPIANAILKVPSARFESAQQQVRKLGDVKFENQTSDDVTKQAVAYRAEIEQVKRKIDALDARLRRARGSEARDLKDRLDQLQGQQSYQKQQLKMIESQTAISTLNVTLTEKSKVTASKEDKSWSDNAWTSASNNFGVVAKLLGAVGINLLVFAPIWLPIVGIVWWMNRRKS